MFRRFGQAGLLVVSAALLLAMLPAVSIAGGAGEPDGTRTSESTPKRSVTVARARLSFLDTCTPDWGEDSDDTTAGAQDMSVYCSGENPLSGWGRLPAEATHTLDWCSKDTSLTAEDAQGDQDWYKFRVTREDAMFGKPYVIEAKALDSWVDPVIEVYGPVDPSHSISPSDPRDIYEAGGATDLDIGNPTCVAASDNGPWFGGGLSSSASFIPNVPDNEVTYYFRVRPYFGLTWNFYSMVDDVRGYLGSAGSYKMRFKVGVATRIAGDDRVGTAIALSRERYASGELPLVTTGDPQNRLGARVDPSTEPPPPGVVILASSASFPDALAGSTLAAAMCSPILLTSPDSLSPEVKDEIWRLGAHKVLLLGSTRAISQAVEDQLRTEGWEVERIAGDNRVQTAARIAVSAKDSLYPGLFSKCAFIVNGWAFPDGLSASPMAAHDLAPILLTHKGSLDASTSEAMTELGITDAILVGGEAAVSANVQSQLATLLGGADHVRRIGGADRYETSRDFAVFAIGNEVLQSGYEVATSTGSPASPHILKTLGHDGMAVCSGSNFPDALAGGVFAGCATGGYPLLLTPGAEAPGGGLPSLWISRWVPSGKAGYLYSLPHGPHVLKRVYIVGGPSAVSASALRQLDLDCHEGVYVLF